SLQVHHAVCDGYHASLFMSEFQNMVDSVNEWI
ncbi:type A chloramphenicol O-acetyltransferase, partial [Enterococcus faecalis]|nr:type A chloramphenicol O-acetyltransferase [Enterococcus faecalis]EIX2782473.1 type A chloramphenicol O-acetyltransferase [Enterococcus faecalis]